jgi:hypothetical protein
MAALEAARQHGVLQLDLELDRRDAFGRVTEQHHLVHAAEPLPIELERHKRDWERNRAAAFDHPPNPTDALPCKSDPDHAYGEDCQRAERDSQPVVSHRFRLPGHRVVCFTM